MNTEQQIEFDKIKEIWAGLAVTGSAKEEIANAGVFIDELELNKKLRDTTNSRKMIENLGNPPLQDVTEIREILMEASKGGCLTPYQLERVEKVLVVVERLKDYLVRGKLFENPLSYYDENLDELPELREEICKKIRYEAVDDHATNVLYDIRTRIVRAEEAVKQKAEQVIRNNKDCMADTFYTLRNGRVCVPVKKEYRYRIPGSVIDKSASGNTVFVEPAALGKHYEELQLLRVEEENEVYNILYTLTALVSEAVPVMEENMSMIEKLDFIFSKGKLSIDLDCTEPKINLDRRIVLMEARHPLMDRKINVPLNFSIGDDIRGIVITGPNTGGKTVSIKTVMLTGYMAQCGLHVPCREADICMNSNYLCDIGDGQNLSENLSTFSAHIKNVLEILQKVNRESFVIMDELGSGTDPAEGMGIATAILEELRKSEANFLVTTHYPEIKEYASKHEHIINARMTFDRETLMPTYSMVIGEAGESCAFYIADRLGMPESMLKVAVEAAYGKDAVKTYSFRNHKEIGRTENRKIQKDVRKPDTPKLTREYRVGDSVMVYPDKKIGIVCEPENDKGVLRVQIAGRKIWINHKRIKLHVKAEELYPEDYDFSIIFDSVENRKIRHDMERKYTEEIIQTSEDE
ncbi:MAG: DNA mismatch repair protein MutS [Lachnospiraceae bacterium]|nr:DNA mismatch repair protein MutS [Lachnospiraceae bacterium]